jgi:tetratricopeptide (TPR) repeat protein
MQLRLFSLSLVLCGCLQGAGSYAGPEVCATCHSAIAQTQRKTAMAGTWQTATAAAMASGFDETAHEGGDVFRVRRGASGFSVETKLAGEPAITLPVEALVGGPRHGISFLIRIDQLSGSPLERSALVEARYAFSTPHKRLIVSPGFPGATPESYETAFGSALSPRFEKQCLECHGQPNSGGAGGHGGVGCESCHGPGLAHAQAVNRADRLANIVNPSKLTSEQAMEVCAQCHTGFNYLADPLPDDLLISSQVTALGNSECAIQSRQEVGCTSCHDPHRQTTSAQVTLASEKTCLHCHGGGTAPHAATCPVNAKAGCVGCHMPAVQKGEFAMVDHWIRVHPELIPAASTHGTSEGSTLRPVREFMRMLATGSAESAEAARARVTSGESFFDVASQISIDASRESGGYLGPTMLADLDPQLADAAALLREGEMSPVLELAGRWIFVQRQPRDFRMDADRLYREAAELKTKGELRGALKRDQEALKVNPRFLRALLFMGATLGEAGQLQRAAAVLTVATEVYPKDSTAEFNLGIILGGVGKTAEQVEAFRKALDLDADNVPVYESLGAALEASGDGAGALQAFRDGLRIDPLSAALNYDLSLELSQRGDPAGAARAKELALKINRKVAPAGR